MARVSRLPSSKEIYNRIRWEPGLDGAWFTIGFEDRDAGLQEIPFQSYVEGGDIPWHRIQYIRCGDSVIWDRRTRLDALASVRRVPQEPARAEPQPFRSLAELQTYLRVKKGSVWVLTRLMPAYPSFVEDVCFHLIGAERVRLSVEWRSYAMDWMGDATHLRIEYEIESLDAALGFIRRRYAREITELTAEPRPLPRSAIHLPHQLHKEVQEAWRRLRSDFAADKLTEGGLRVVYRSDGRTGGSS